MLTKNQYETLFAYHWHTTGQLIDYAAQLSQDDYHWKSKDGRDSVHEVLFHILGADYGWREGLISGVQQAPLSRKDYPDLQALRTGFEREQSAWSEYLDNLTEEQIESEITLKRASGEAMTFILWRILQHVVMHGMQHHAEIAALLTEKGQSPGNIDFLFYR